MPTWTSSSAPKEKNLTDEKVKALFEISIMEEMREIFKESDLSEDDTVMLNKMAQNSVRTLIGHVYDGDIGSSEFCEMQRALFRTFIALLHNR